jgi:hypothetical protein
LKEFKSKTRNEATLIAQAGTVSEKCQKLVQSNRIDQFSRSWRSKHPQTNTQQTQQLPKQLFSRKPKASGRIKINLKSNNEELVKYTTTRRCQSTIAEALIRRE